MRNLTPIFGAALIVLPALCLAQMKPPVVLAKSAVVMDAESGRILWSRDKDKPRFPASTTKVLTGLMLLEHTQPTDIIQAPPLVEKEGGSSLHLKPGETLTARDLLYAIMLRSANDGCVTIAHHIAGSVPAFVTLMNQRAKEIGCTHTTFNNPNGLNDPLHKTSANDLALIAREAMKRPDFRDVVKTQKQLIGRSMNDKDRWMINRNKWLRKDQTADGIKTGWTVPAGHCYVGSATREGYRVITVLLDSKNWQEDHAALLNWAYKNYDRKLVAHAGQQVAQFAVKGGTIAKVPVITPKKITVLVEDKKSAPALTFEQTVDSAPLIKGQKIGVAHTPDGEAFDVLADADVPVKSASLASANPLSFLVFGTGIAACAYYVRRKARGWNLGR